MGTTVVAIHQARLWGCGKLLGKSGVSAAGNEFCHVLTGSQIHQKSGSFLQSVQTMGPGAGANGSIVVAKQTLSTGQSQFFPADFSAVCIQYIHVKQPSDSVCFLDLHSQPFQLHDGHIHHIVALAAGAFPIQLPVQHPDAPQRILQQPIAYKKSDGYIPVKLFRPGNIHGKTQKRLSVFFQERLLGRCSGFPRG